MKKRCFPESNYKAIYINGKTLRMTLDPNKPITDLEYPEFYDVKITNHCNGRCPYCYQSSEKTNQHFKNVPQKIIDYFGSMTENQRPFQVAIGGGEPTTHPQFNEICKLFKELDIDPNYTTNGTNMTKEVLETTTKYCNGVAVSCHEHLNWSPAVELLLYYRMFTALHVILSDEESVNRFLEIYNNYSGSVNYFVLLPMIAQGRAQCEFNCWEYLEKQLNSLGEIPDIAFGAMFYPHIKTCSNRWNISLYEPEIMSKYLVMDDSMKLYPSSFATQKEE